MAVSTITMRISAARWALLCAVLFFLIDEREIGGWILDRAIRVTPVL